MDSGSSKERRDKIKSEINALSVVLRFNYGKKTQLSNLKAALAFLRKEHYFQGLVDSVMNKLNPIRHLEAFDRNDALSLTEDDSGFITCFSKTGQIIYLSENVEKFLAFKSMDGMLSYDSIQDLVHEQDKPSFENLATNCGMYANKKFSINAMMLASKTNKKKHPMSNYIHVKMSGTFSSNMFIVTCQPFLTVQNRDLLVNSSGFGFTSVHALDLQLTGLCPNGETLLGYVNNASLKEINLYDLANSESLTKIRDMHVQILNTKCSKGLVQNIQLIKKDGSLLECLVNMYYEQKNIICKYQVLDESDIEMYNNYIFEIGLNESRYGSAFGSPMTENTEDDENSISECSFNMDDVEPSTSTATPRQNKKRKADSDPEIVPKMVKIEDFPVFNHHEAAISVTPAPAVPLEQPIDDMTTILDEFPEQLNSFIDDPRQMEAILNSLTDDQLYFTFEQLEFKIPDQFPNVASNGSFHFDDQEPNFDLEALLAMH